MSTLDLETLLADFDHRARSAQDRLEQQRQVLARFQDMARGQVFHTLSSMAARLERSGHEADVSLGHEVTSASASGTGGADPETVHYVQLRLTPRAFPGQRVARAPDRYPLVRYQLDLDDGVVRIWARDVSLDGKDVEVGFRNDADGLPAGYALEALTPDVVRHHALLTIAFALRESAQTALF